MGSWWECDPQREPYYLPNVVGQTTETRRRYQLEMTRSLSWRAWRLEQVKQTGGRGCLVFRNSIRDCFDFPGVPKPMSTY